MVAAATAVSTVSALADEVPSTTADPEGREAPEPPKGYEGWDRRMERPLLVAAVAFLVVLCLPVLAPGLPDGADRALGLANLAIWAFFTVDYLARLYLAHERVRFVRTHVLDLLIVVVPFFRPLRLLRLVSLASRMGQRNRGALVADVTKLVTLAAVGTAFLGAVLALDAERDAPETVIANFPDALWWALGTMTAVPYGDVYPVTQEGRVVSAVLMILGLVFVGIITAAIAAWFVGLISDGDEDAQAAAELAAVNARLAAVEELLRELSAAKVPAQRKRATPRS